MACAPSKCFSGQWLTIATFIAASLAFLTSTILRTSITKTWSQREIININFVGEIYLRILRMLVLPIMLSSLISSIASMDLQTAGKIGKQIITYYLSTTTIAILFGVALALLFHPGGGANTERPTHDIEDINNVPFYDSLLDLVRNLFPINWMEACLYQTQTVYKRSPTSNDTENSDWIVSIETTEGTNYMGIVSIGCICGIAASSMQDSLTDLIDAITEFYRIATNIISWLIYLTPLGVFALILAQMLEIEDMHSMLNSLGLYLLIICAALCVHAFIILPAIYYMVIRKNPYEVLSGLLPVIATAFGTSSSAATLPVAIRYMVEKIKINKAIANSLLPLGTSLNMNGNALYQGVAVIFIAQIREQALTMSSLFAITVTAMAASIATAGVPAGGLVTMIMVLDAINLPPEDISFVVSVDWLIDRFCTMVNVLGNCFGAAIVSHLNKEMLSTHED